jgi:hypothetical protein
MIYMEPGLSPSYRHEEKEEGKEGLEEEEEEASPGFVDFWLRRFLASSLARLPFCFMCGTWSDGVKLSSGASS